MKLFLFALGLCLCSYTFGVYVQEGDRSFPLEAVKVLKGLIDTEDFETSVVSVCKNPLLPQIFIPVCQERMAPLILSRLVMIITPLDRCELCFTPACIGCFI